MGNFSPLYMFMYVTTLPPVRAWDLALKQVKLPWNLMALYRQLWMQFSRVKVNSVSCLLSYVCVFKHMSSCLFRHILSTSSGNSTLHCLPSTYTELMCIGQPTCMHSITQYTITLHTLPQVKVNPFCNPDLSGVHCMLVMCGDDTGIRVQITVSRAQAGKNFNIGCGLG